MVAYMQTVKSFIPAFRCFLENEYYRIIRFFSLTKPQMLSQVICQLSKRDGGQSAMYHIPYIQLNLCKRKEPLEIKQNNTRSWTGAF